MSAKLSHLAVAGIVAPILRTLQAGERIVRRNDAGELVTLDLAEIARRVGAATGHTIAVARKRPVKVVGADGTVVKELTADEFLAKMLSRHFGVEVTPPRANAKVTLFWCACGKVEELRKSGTKRRCSACGVKASRARKIAYRAAHREAVNSRANAHRAANREAVLAKEWARIAANRDVIIAQKRARYAANRETICARKNAHHAANREAANAKQRAARAAKKLGAAK